MGFDTVASSFQSTPAGTYNAGCDLEQRVRCGGDFIARAESTNMVAEEDEIHGDCGARGEAEWAIYDLLGAERRELCVPTRICIITNIANVSALAWH